MVMLLTVSYKAAFKQKLSAVEAMENLYFPLVMAGRRPMHGFLETREAKNPINLV
jgi:hypothetical protein